MMEKESNPPPYPGPQVTQTGMNFPGHQGAYTAQTDPSPYPPPPPYGFGAPPTNVQPMAVPVVTQVVVMSTLTDVPGRITCPLCHQDVVTEIEHSSGLLTWLICGTLAIFACWLCCCIPFCVDSCKDVKHSCPNCKNVIRVYSRV
ncbi:lipopolysaccharide-induced tumor necrosis factor-alpha factor homolog [Misgurnus anguillicaudatus]|uniref:lipopolysaccharide-induced tumor necrosis factor-alpha factor homolog n=1 Tax=Misgurnus anguillicaudatus TaxID=75329 RepID=UPI00243538D9|nr:lipopolysaccharide-induced tumor necrosis factor-alpha factor homolog [Misgurnus anguillicaudatus]